MTHLKITALYIFSIILLASCGDTNTRPAPAQTELSANSYTLPNGEIIKGYKRQYKSGYYIGEMANGQPNGKGAFIFNNKTGYSTGNYINGKQDGLHKVYNTINGIITYNLIKDGTSIQSYGELDALLATGDFDKAASKRGPRVFLGIRLQDDKPFVKALKVIKNSPADLAGIKQGDRLMALNSQSLLDKNVSLALQALIKLKYDQPVDIKIQRDGNTRNIRMIPGIIPSTHPAVTPSAQLLWHNIKAANASAVYQQYIDTIVDEKYKQEARRHLAVILKKEQLAYNASKNQGDKGLFRFCQNYPSSNFLADALDSFFQQIEDGKNFIRRYQALTRQCTHAVKYQPAYYELLTTGPESMTVKKLLTMLDSGMSSTVIAAKVKTRDKAYKDFTLDEIAHLNAFGMTDEIISAMIEATYVKKKSDQIKQRLEKLEAENRQLKAAQHRKQQAAPAKVVKEKNMPLECIKLAAALKACDETSGFLSMGCKAVAKSQFDCPIPLN